MTRKEIFDDIKANIKMLPLTFQFLKENVSENNDNIGSIIDYKSAGIEKMQSNDVLCGIYYKNISRMIKPFKEDKNPSTK